MTLARRVIPIIDVTAEAAPALPYTRGGLDVPFLEAVARYHANDGADELWLRLVHPDARGAAALFEPLNALRERLFIPVVAWGSVGSPADARLLVGLGAERVVVDITPHAGGEALGLVHDIAQSIGSDRVSVAMLVRRVATKRRVRWELCSPTGEGSGHDAQSAAQTLAAAGAGELIVVPWYLPPEGPPRAAHDADLVDALLSLLSIPLVSVGDDREAADMAAALLIGADGVASSTLFSDGGVTVAGA
ncbi:MAG: HisA/HisF-related TIM barrel protein, partial [Myxococcota bacterium]